MVLLGRKIKDEVKALLRQGMLFREQIFIQHLATPRHFRLYRIAPTLIVIASCVPGAIQAGTVSCQDQARGEPDRPVVSGDEVIIQKCPPTIEKRRRSEQRQITHPVADKTRSEKPQNNIDIIDITTLGAVADGKSDTYPILMKALKNASIIHIPRGDFFVSRSIKIPSNVDKIYGPGALVGGDQFGIIRQTNSLKNIEISGLTFRFTPTKDTIYGAIYFDGGKFENITIKDCTFLGGKHQTNAILMVGKDKNTITNLRIISNQFINIRRAAIEILHRTRGVNVPSAVNKVIIKDNAFKYTLDSNPTSRGFNPAISLSQIVRDTRIDSNSISGYKWGIEVDGAINTAITNNTITQVEDAINSGNNARDTQVTNNLLSSKRRTQFRDDFGLLIKSNQIEGPLHLVRTHGAVVEGNTISGTEKVNVWIDNAQGSMIVDNTIINRSSHPWDAIRGYGNKSDSSNKVFDNRISIVNGVLTRNSDGATVDFGENVAIKE